MYFSYQGLTPGDIELVKKFPQFLSASTRNIFNFVQEHHWTMYSPFHSTSFCHFLGSFIFPSSQQLLSFFFFFFFFEQRPVPGAFYSLPGNWKCFPLWESYKEQNKWKPEGTISGEYSGWIRISQPSCNSFCLVIKEICSFTLSWWKIKCFL